MSALNIRRQAVGITVNQISTQTVGSTITRVFAISPDVTVPAGLHEVRFEATVAGWTGSTTAPLPQATFSLTVTP